MVISKSFYGKSVYLFMPNLKFDTTNIRNILEFRIDMIAYNVFVFFFCLLRFW